MSDDKHLGHKTLIAGEIHSGKTIYTLAILRSLRGKAPSSHFVLDLAPEETRGVGGKIPLTPEEKTEILYLSPLILPPRMMGKDETEVLRLAEENRRRIDPILAQIKRRGPTFLLVNDITLYLQNGKADHLMSCIEGIPMIIMNGYYGRYFGKNSFSQRERYEMEALMSRCDRVVFLPPLSMS